MNPRLPRVLAVVPGMIPPAVIYVIKPLTALAMRGLIILDVIEEYQFTEEKINWCDVLALSRNCEPVHSVILDRIRALQKPVIYDLDDNFWEIPPDTPDGAYLTAPERIAMLEGYLRQATMVRVFNPILLQKVKQFNPNAVLLNPCIDLSLFPKEAIPSLDGKVRIAYATTRGREDVLKDVFVEDLGQILDKYPQKVEAYFWGVCPPSLQQMANVTVLPIVKNYDHFLKTFSRQGFDIGLAPMTATPFHQSKTDTKFRDYGAARIAGIFSDVDLYARVVTPEKTGLLAGQAPGDWYRAMERLIVDRALRETIKSQAYQYVAEHYSQEAMESSWIEQLKMVLAPFKWAEPEGLFTFKRNINAPRRISLEFPPDAGLSAAVPAVAEMDPRMDAAADPDQPLRFEDNSIDLVFAYHTLSFVNDLSATLKEVLRVCRVGAQVCVVAPFRKQTQDKHHPSTRYFFDEKWPDTLDLILNGKSFQLANIQYFYYPLYRGLPPQDQEIIRNQKQNVCDRIMFHFRISGVDESDQERNQMTDQWTFFEPPQVTARRWQDLYEIDTSRLKQELSALEAQQRGAILALENKISELQEQHRMTIQEMQDHHRATLQELQDKYHASMQDMQENQQTVIQELQEQHRAALQELEERIQATTRELESRVHSIGAQLEKHKEEAANYQTRAIWLSQNLDTFRQRKIFRWVERFFNRSDASVDLPPHYQRLLDDSLLYQNNLKGWKLRPSINLQLIPYLSYSLDKIPPGLKGLTIAPLLDIPANQGVIGVEIISAQKKTVVQSLTPLRDVNVTLPLEITFDPIRNAGGMFELRVFAHTTDAPVRIYEWQRYSLLGFGPLKRKAFVSMDFE